MDLSVRRDIEEQSADSVVLLHAQPTRRHVRLDKSREPGTDALEQKPQVSGSKAFGFNNKGHVAHAADRQLRRKQAGVDIRILLLSCP